MTSLARRCTALLAVAGLMLTLFACSTIGVRPSITPPPPATSVATTSPAATPLATSAEATSVVTGTIYPQTFDPNATPTPVPPQTPFPTPQPQGMADLIYALVDQLGQPDWCDPDFYPLARGDEVTVAREHLAEMQSDTTLYQTILDHNGISPNATLTDDQLVTVYRDWKVLTEAIVLTPSGDRYTFDYVALRGTYSQQADFHVAGSISSAGEISTTTNEPTTRPNCPICLARGTLIDTPSGPIPVELLRPGMTVWTSDGNGRRVAAPVVKVGSMPVPATHRVVHLVLVDGRTVDVSPGHPLADGRPVGDLRPGDALDGSTVLSADLVAYSGGATFDLLPAGPFGTYWANGILLGSTLAGR